MRIGYTIRVELVTGVVRTRAPGGLVDHVHPDNFTVVPRFGGKYAYHLSNYREDGLPDKFW